MSADEQLTYAEVKELSRRDPAGLMDAMRAGRVSELMSGRDPSSCPTCGRPMTEAAE